MVTWLFVKLNSKRWIRKVRFFPVNYQKTDIAPFISNNVFPTFKFNIDFDVDSFTFCWVRAMCCCPYWQFDGQWIVHVDGCGLYVGSRDVIIFLRTTLVYFRYFSNWSFAVFGCYYVLRIQATLTDNNCWTFAEWKKKWNKKAYENQQATFLSYSF